MRKNKLFLFFTISSLVGCTTQQIAENSKTQRNIAAIEESFTKKIEFETNLPSENADADYDHVFFQLSSMVPDQDCLSRDIDLSWFSRTLDSANGPVALKDIATTIVLSETYLKSQIQTGNLNKTDLTLSSEILKVNKLNAIFLCRLPKVDDASSTITSKLLLLSQQVARGRISIEKIEIIKEIMTRIISSQNQAIQMHSYAPPGDYSPHEAGIPSEIQREKTILKNMGLVHSDANEFLQMDFEGQ